MTVIPEGCYRGSIHGISKIRRTASRIDLDRDLTKRTINNNGKIIYCLVEPHL